MLASIKQYLKDFDALFFPRVCQSCGRSLVKTESCFCTICIYQLPYTKYHLDQNNKLAKQFWGRLDIASAAAFLYFNKAGKVQNMMHQLKYNNQPQVGVELGKMYGKELVKEFHYNNIEAIIPVPLHPKKFKKRGYNQSEQFAIGLSEIMKIPVYNQILYRDLEKESQTGKSRTLRFDNMEAVFKAEKPNLALNNILLVDDTITTGATLESCALVLQSIGIKKINIVGIAFTE
ncbi:ComF family protein [Pedobacter sp. SD-b]|uniref:ComF family protein n=1 Tax=Pedobacter segetis TaxID=2793069 RepID=A0ABS1BIQ2_9SPHI|nr:ComF family protein [Pedobacter segetis]MBK0382718.1 ComF family protein [Pedobacter segetis]